MAKSVDLGNPDEVTEYLAKKEGKNSGKQMPLTCNFYMPKFSDTISLDYMFGLKQKT